MTDRAYGAPFGSLHGRWWHWQYFVGDANGGETTKNESTVAVDDT